MNMNMNQGIVCTMTLKVLISFLRKARLRKKKLTKNVDCQTSVNEDLSYSPCLCLESFARSCMMGSKYIRTYQI